MVFDDFFEKYKNKTNDIFLSPSSNLPKIIFHYSEVKSDKISIFLKISISRFSIFDALGFAEPGRFRKVPGRTPEGAISTSRLCLKVSVTGHMRTHR